MEIRKVCKEDHDAVFQILSEAMGSSYLGLMEEEFSRAISGEYQGFVAMLDGRLVGYACLRSIVETWKLETLATHAEYRSRGIGSAVIVFIEEFVRSSGKKVINLDTDPDDLRTVNFYLRNGFKVSGYVENEYAPGVTKIHLSRLLMS